MEKSQPSLSVVVVTRDNCRTLQPILAALGEQTVASQLELVIVAPDRESGIPKEQYRDPFHSWQVVAAGPIESRGRAAALGVIVARAPLVALSENHCFPDRDWAENVISIHAEGPWVGLGPAVSIANPETTLSRLLHTAGYGRFSPKGSAETREELPLHNSSFQTEVLRSFDPDLPDLLGDERRLNRTLVEGGYELRFDPRARKRHINEATWGLLAGLAFSGGRRYGGQRSQAWPPWKRIAYGLATPLLSVPITLNLLRQLPPGKGAGARGVWIGVAAWIYALLHAAGEGASYFFGGKEDFPFVEREEFYIRERLGSVPLSDPEIKTLVDHLDR